MTFKNYHFHLYYPVEMIEKAKNILDKLKQEKEDIQIGTIWDKPVGPHPVGSCQIKITDKNFYEMIEWFFINRQGLSLFIHADTGDDHIDHTDYVLWMGKEYKLNLDIFKKD